MAMFKSKEKGVLPGLNYPEKPCKNFLLENIKKLREIQRETQKKLASQHPSHYHSFKKVPDLKIRSYQKRNKSEPELVGCDSEDPSLKSRLSTPITAMASSKPVKNQKMQTVTSDKIHKGKVMLSRTSAGAAIKKPDNQPDRLKVRSSSVPSLSYESSDADSSPNINSVDNSASNKEALEKLINSEKKDFVTYNTYRTYHEKVKPKKLDPIKPPPNYRVGELPKYLLAAKNDDKSKGGCGDADAGQCPGYILLSERERKDHLEDFKKTYSDLVFKLRNIPISSDSYSNRQKKMRLEKELEKLEELMKLFSRGKLYLKVS